MKYLLLMVDGGADRLDFHGKTPLSSAIMPNTTLLASAGLVGMLDLKYGSKVDSDVGFLTILGYDKRECAGRGYLEALGAGLEPGKDSLCIRANFATVDKEGMIIDRRAGRDNTGLRELVKTLDGMEMDGIAFRMVKSAGHRVIIVLEDHRLSDAVESNDPRAVGVPLPQVQPKDEGGKFTASILNRFSYKANKILSKHPINRKRKHPANVLVIRSIGKARPAESFRKKFNLTACCIAGIPIANGVARYLGMDVISVDGATGYPDTNWAGKVQAAIKALRKYDFVWLHINACDILAHDKKREEKRKYLELIDSGLGRILQEWPESETVYIITPDHRTVSLADFREYEHVADPVPVLISGGKIKPNGIGRYNEMAAEKGFRIEGHSLMNFVLGQKRF